MFKVPFVAEPTPNDRKQAQRDLESLHQKVCCLADFLEELEFLVGHASSVVEEASDHLNGKAVPPPASKTGRGEGNGGKTGRSRRPKRKRKTDPKAAQKRTETKARHEKEEAIHRDWSGQEWVGGYQGYVDWKNQNLPQGWAPLTRYEVTRAIENVTRRARYKKR